MWVGHAPLIYLPKCSNVVSTHIPQAHAAVCPSWHNQLVYCVHDQLETCNLAIMSPPGCQRAWDHLILYNAHAHIILIFVVSEERLIYWYVKLISINRCCNVRLQCNINCTIMQLLGLNHLIMKRLQHILVQPLTAQTLHSVYTTKRNTTQLYIHATSN